VVESVITVNFCAHVHAYCVCSRKPVLYIVLGIGELLDYHPLYCHATGFAQDVHKQFIRVPYIIFSNAKSSHAKGNFLANRPATQTVTQYDQLLTQYDQLLA